MNPEPFRPAAEADHRVLLFPAATPFHADGGFLAPTLKDGRAEGAASEPSKQSDTEQLRELRGALMVVASLMATATYQAAVAPPSQLQEADYNRFVAFRVFNSFSFVNSVGIMMHLILEAVVTGNVISLATMKLLMIISLLCFGVAFGLVISNSWSSTSYAVVSPLYYFLMCLFIEYTFKRKQGRAEARPVATTTTVELPARA